jgi:two-component system chemotaxis response regulator CheB
MAYRYRERAIAVVLTGKGSDGACGAQAVRRRSGFVIVQDKRTSAHFDVPCAAIETRKVDLVLPLEHIAFALEILVRNGTEPRSRFSVCLGNRLAPPVFLE